MNIRSKVHDLIARDAVLSAVHVTHTERGRCGRAPARTGVATCSLVFEWVANDEATAPVDSQLLTVWAHLPRQRAREHLFLEFLLQRVRAVLLTGTADGSITGEYRGMSGDVMASKFGTVCKNNRFRVTARQPRQEEITLLGLVPWAGVDRDSAWFGALSGAAQTVN